MTAPDFLNLYKRDSLVQALAEGLRTPTPDTVSIRNLHGSLDAVLFAAVQGEVRASHVIICVDKEEAAYLANDLQNLVGRREVLIFPMSYKRPYEYEETENANVLMRAEVLSRLSDHPDSQIILTYPEALSEKVITKKSLAKNTFRVKKGERVDVAFLEEFLNSYDFEKADFVYEAGQFAVRGGIIDVFSFANEWPYRIELFGDEVDSIRTFNPGSQLSIEEHHDVSLMPNVQTRLVLEDRQSFLEYIPAHTRIWLRDTAYTLAILDKCHEKVGRRFDEIIARSGAPAGLPPEALFETEASFRLRLEQFHRIEWGPRPFFTPARTFDFPSAAQTSFQKNFELLAANLLEYQQRGYTNFIAADQSKQLERLQGIFEEIHPELRFQPMPFSLREGYIDHTLKLACYTDHQIFERYHRYRTKEKFSKSKALTFRELHTLQPGDFVTHIDYGIARFAGLEKKDVNGKEQEAIRLVFRDNDLLYINIHALHKISRYTGKDGAPPAISKLGSGEWDSKKAKVKNKVKDIAKELIDLYAKRKASPGFAFSSDGFLQAELESSFLYEDTPDQAKATDDVKRDMEQPHPMDRLVCGDVGFGKTEVAIRAAFKATTDGKQVAVLVPTTILALQHYRTFRDRLANLPVRVEYISRFRSDKDTKAIAADVKAGHVNILIGTHRIVGRDLSFHDLGLLIIDEEQKFGVKVKDKLKALKLNLDVLTLTATPIPRTLHFSLMGARDLSIIATPPPNRQPVSTEVHVFQEEIIRDAVSQEIRRGGQVFFVHNRIHDIEQVANVIYKLVPDSRIGIAHGQMEGDKLEKVMVRFIEGEYDVLVSTNIIESGLDIPNANTIIINQAHLFGLSDLHQMRGRVGRSNKKAYCYLLTPPANLLSADSRKRLAALEEFSELGDGFKVAMRDLDIRGAGNLLGSEQSGFISDLGFEAYHKILDDAILELKETEFKELFATELAERARQLVPDCLIETDLEILIPDTYVGNTSERLHLYATLDNIATESELTQFVDALRDRFGEMPPPVQQLINTVRVRWLGEQLGFEKLSLKNEKIKAQFMSKEEYFKSEVFGRVLAFVQKNPGLCRVKESGGKSLLTIEKIPTVEQALAVLSQI